ncbi:hypothetical protein [Flectobacillus longus]|uniref:hypothetical protein n=1 Tax=Flectobacillus longus TaxID=2984207 RepID=UPI0024B7D8F9|nr:hypothetical protein [Flectobacillus longus]MDI9879381.1 hypothetical protein [Flectobacillus longus]
MKKIFIAGGYTRENGDSYTEQKEFAFLLGREIMLQNHILLNACKTEFDSEVCKGAADACTNQREMQSRIISYVLKGEKPIHNYGDVKQSLLSNWDLDGDDIDIPEPIKYADVIILVGGFVGTKRAANWARLKNKPILPITRFNGESEKIYHTELENFDKKYSTRIKQEDYEDLNQINSSSEDFSSRVVSIAEEISTPSFAFTIMPFKDTPELTDVFDTFQEACRQYRYNCIRMDEVINTQNIFPEMMNHIEKCAFALIDITESSHNVYFELGYAYGLKKDFIITAKRGTTLPFDIQDLQIVFWQSQVELRSSLLKRISIIASEQGRI